MVEELLFSICIVFWAKNTGGVRPGNQHPVNTCNVVGLDRAVSRNPHKSMWNFHSDF